MLHCFFFKKTTHSNFRQFEPNPIQHFLCWDDLKNEKNAPAQNIYITQIYRKSNFYEKFF